MRPNRLEDTGLFFHELVHVLQWEQLGLRPFIHAYGVGLLEGGYWGVLWSGWPTDWRRSSGGESLRSRSSQQSEPDSTLPLDLASAGIGGHTRAVAMVPEMYVVSALLQRFRADTVAFARELPGCWLVWEPGPWRPATTSKKTMVLTSVKSGHGGAGESLAMHLGTPPVGTRLALGRAEGSQLYINDATLSQAHLVLEASGANRWSIIDVGSLNGTWVNWRTRGQQARSPQEQRPDPGWAGLPHLPGARRDGDAAPLDGVK